MSHPNPHLCFRTLSSRQPPPHHPSPPPSPPPLSTPLPTTHLSFFLDYPSTSTRPPVHLPELLARLWGGAYHRLASIILFLVFFSLPPSKLTTPAPPKSSSINLAAQRCSSHLPKLVSEIIVSS